ncbi:predicted protein [Chaetoceros tenuissimus]|uniref:PDZ domain-containing protein n=1 Tax=Chaetoceros tenuissimus TaxID=426638 RepID=A0AAD3HCH4_9STRA|nr:predicted protein [Chaetoceros tenuissimus]
MEPSELEEYLQAKEAKRIERNAKQREKRAKLREEEEEMMNSMEPSELEEYLQAKEAERIERIAKLREEEEEMMNSMEPSELEEYLQAKEAKRIERNAKQREKRAKLREEEEEMMDSMEPSELEEYLQAKEAERIERIAKLREEEEEMMNSMEPSELEEYLQAKEAKRIERNAKQREWRAKLREEEEEMMDSMEPSELEEYLQAKEAKQREKRAKLREEEEEMMNSMEPSELEEYLQAKEAKRIERNAKRREKRAKLREEEEEMMNSMEPSELEEYLQAKEAERSERNAKRREWRAKRQAKKKEEKALDENEGTEREPTMIADEITKSADGIFARWPELHDDNRSRVALYASFTAEDLNKLFLSRALWSSESHKFLTNPTFYISKRGFLHCKGAGPSLLFSSPRKDFGARCRRRDSNGLLVPTELDYRILSRKYLEEQLDAKFIILHQCQSRTNARNMENEIQGRLGGRKFGTEILWRAIDRGNYDKEKGDDTATFTVGLTVLNAEKIRDLIKNGVIVVNKGKWSHSKQQYFHELDNGRKQYFKSSYEEIDFGSFTVQTSQEVLRIRVIQTKYCYLEIDEVHDDSPLNGLVRKGDQIRAINGRDMSNASGTTFVEVLQSLRTEKKTITMWRG